MLERMRKGYTQQEIADELDVSRGTVNAWEKGRQEPNLTLRQIKKLCELLDFTLETLPDDFGPQPIHPSSPFYGRRSKKRSNEV
jgi:DNA-binding XRE family transcriptional regulator